MNVLRYRKTHGCRVSTFHLIGMLTVFARKKVGFMRQFYVDTFFTQSSLFAVITLLLRHEPDKRPTALELSQSPLLPSRLEDDGSGTVISIYVGDVVGSTISNVGNNNSGGIHLFSSCFIYSFLPISSYLDYIISRSRMILHASCRLMTSRRFCRSSLTKLRLAISTVENHPTTRRLPSHQTRESKLWEEEKGEWKLKSKCGLLLMMDNGSGTEAILKFKTGFSLRWRSSNSYRSILISYGARLATYYELFSCRRCRRASEVAIIQGPQPITSKFRAWGGLGTETCLALKHSPRNYCNAYGVRQKRKLELIGTTSRSGFELPIWPDFFLCSLLITNGTIWYIGNLVMANKLQDVFDTKFTSILHYSYGLSNLRSHK